MSPSSTRTSAWSPPLSVSNPQQPATPPTAGAAQVDLTAGVASGALVVSAETREDPADRGHRHAQESADAKLRRWKDGIRFALSATLIVAITVIAGKMALDPAAPAEEKAWGRTVLAAIASAVAGYFIGRTSKE